MASFVAEVLNSAGQLETQEATSKLRVLSNKIDGLKLEVNDMTHNKCKNFQLHISGTEQLMNDVESIKTEMQDVENKIESQIKSQLNISTGEFQSLTGQLTDINCSLVVLEKLVNLKDGLDSLKAAEKRQDYSKAADALHSVEQLLIQPVYKHEQEISILTSIKTECRVQSEGLINDLREKWKDTIQWTTVNTSNDNSEENVSKTCLKILSQGDSSKLESVILGMKKMNCLEDKMKHFGEDLFSNLITPIMNYEEITLSENEPGIGVTLSLSMNCEPKQCSPSVPANMFQKLDKVLRFLNTHLLYVVLDDGKEGEDQQTLMSVLGKIIGDKTLELAVKQCLIKAIPRSHKELESFNKVVQMTELAHNQLVALHFIESTNRIFGDYVQNVTVLFANKKCQELQEAARKLMTSEVHDTMVVTHDKPIGELLPLAKGVGGGKKARRDDLPADSILSGKTFRLPTCHISCSIQELMIMAYETLLEAGESSQQCAIQMYCAVREMFEQFSCVFPTYHKQSLESLPQFAALHYNNCMYIAHHLMLFGHQFSKKLPTTINATFVDLVPKIRRLGTEAFMYQLTKQKAQLSEYLSAANGFRNVSEKEIFFTSNRAIKQVLHQLQHLRNVWQDILTPSTYRKAIGGLLNGVMVKIADSIVSLEDISADDAKQLSQLITTLTKQSPELLTVQSEEEANITVELHRNVPKWQRFQELDMVLNASMIEIGDRWASGKGPLAVAFSANEIKQLIRALFQNTDRRAAMLAKIK
ncbi:Centromere/kinetochore protein zw10 [Mactra antiquata]